MRIEIESQIGERADLATIVEYKKSLPKPSRGRGWWGEPLRHALAAVKGKKRREERNVHSR